MGKIELGEKLTFEIVEHIGILAKHEESGWAKELNKVSWNGSPAKYDIREWSADHERMSRGITLTDEQMECLVGLMNERYLMLHRYRKTNP